MYISRFPVSFHHDHQNRHFSHPGMSGAVKV
jgi:hypothetical protein